MGRFLDFVMLICILSLLLNGEEKKSCCSFVGVCYSFLEAGVGKCENIVGNSTILRALLL